MEKIELSLIIPIYKKEKTIKAELENIYNALKSTPYSFEIICVVDGTELDDSLNEAKKVDKEEISVYGYEKNKGKGLAVRYGMSLAKGRLISFIDSGGDIAPEGINMLVEHMNWYNADIIIGSKLHSASIVKNYSVFRKFLTFSYYLFVKFLFRLRIRDTQTGLKVFRREVLNSVLPKLVIKQYAFDVELLAVANSMGFKKIYDAPINIDFGKDVSVLFSTSLYKNIYRIFIDTLAIWFRMYIIRYYEDAHSREMYYDQEIKMWINTGNVLSPEKQKLINFINTLYSKLFSNKKTMKDKKKVSEKNPLVSVIVPTRSNGYYVIFELLPALNEQAYKNFEVILLPDLRDPYDLKLTQKYPWLKIKPTLNIKSPSEKRNIGVSEASGELLAFIDSDAYPDKNWLKNAVNYLYSTDSAAVCGPGVLPKESGFWERVFDEVLKNHVGSAGLKYRFYPQKPRYIDDYPSMNFIIKKDIYQQLGGFLNYYPGEDSKLCNELVNKLNKKIYYHPSILVYHHRRKEFGSYIKQHMSYGEHRGAFFAAGDKNSRRLNYLVPTLFISYLILLVLLFFLSISGIFNLQFSYMQLSNIQYLISLVLYLPAYLYLWVLIFQLVNAFLNTYNIKIAVLSVFTLISTHFTYAYAFIKGFLQKEKYQVI